MKYIFEDIIPKTKKDLISNNDFWPRTYKSYIPKKGDIFYWADWWLGSAITGYEITLNINYKMFETYFKEDNPIVMYQKDIFRIDDKYHQFDIGHTLNCGEYKVTKQTYEVGKQKLIYFEDEVILNENYNKSEKILTFNKENNLIIIAKSFEQLKTNLDIFSEALNFNICNKVEDALKLRIESLNKLSL
jgi:hypothetical protein